MNKIWWVLSTPGIHQHLPARIKNLILPFESLKFVPELFSGRISHLCRGRRQLSTFRVWDNKTSSRCCFDSAGGVVSQLAVSRCQPKIIHYRTALVCGKKATEWTYFFFLSTKNQVKLTYSGIRFLKIVSELPWGKLSWHLQHSLLFLRREISMHIYTLDKHVGFGLLPKTLD